MTGAYRKSQRILNDEILVIDFMTIILFYV